MPCSTRRMLAGLLLCNLIIFTGIAFGEDSPGKIFVSDKNGNPVKSESKFGGPSDVYLNGGPQSPKGSGLPDGTYYFLVTDPSGDKLLSTDNASCRQLTVTDGKVAGASDKAGACQHANGTTANGATPVQLIPFAQSPNDGNEYKVWIVRAKDATVSGRDPRVLNFKESDARKDTFKLAFYAMPPGVCLPVSSESVLVSGNNVFSYVPKGSWFQNTPGADNGISIVKVEPAPAAPKLIPTDKPVNSCASNPVTGQTVCTANENDAYVISGIQFVDHALSAANGVTDFSTTMFCPGNCGVTMDAIHNRAVVGLSLNSPDLASNDPAFFGGAGYQILELVDKQSKGDDKDDKNKNDNDNDKKNDKTGHATFEPPFLSEAPLTMFGTGRRHISEGILVDPIRNLILSPNEHSNYEIVKLSNADDDNRGDGKDDRWWRNNDSKDDDNDKGRKNRSNITLHYPLENVIQNEKFPFSAFGSAGEDCATGIILATRFTAAGDPSFSPESRVYVADLNQATVTLGYPAGKWNAPYQIQTLSESVLDGFNATAQGANGAAVAQGTHTGILTGGWRSSSITAISLPSSSGNGVPKVEDWVTCSITGFATGLDPHTVTAYLSPNSGDAIGLVADWPLTRLARVDLTKLLNASRSTPHTCAKPLTPGDGILTFVPVVP